jgi:O-antigen ligase
MSVALSRSEATARSARLSTVGEPGIGVRPVLVIQAMLLLLVTANLGRIPVLSTGERQAPILINDLAVAVILGTAALAGLRARSFRLDAVALLVLLFALIGAGSALLAVPRFGLSPFELLVSLAYLARWCFYAAVYFAIANLVRRRDVEAVWNAAENMLLLFAGFGIVQVALLPGFAQMVYPESRAYYDWDIQGRRLVSTVLEPNVASGMLLLGFLILLARLATGAPVKRWKLAVMFAALVLTLSRSGALGLFVGGGVILLARGLSRRMMRAIAAIAVLVAVAAPLLLRFAAGYNKLGFDASAAARLVSWARAAQVVIDHPWFGVGFNTFGFVLERAYGIQRLGTASYSSDGGLLFVAAMSGLVGLAVYVVMCGVIVLRCRFIWRATDATPGERGFATGVAASVFAIIVHSLFVNSLLTPFVMELLWTQWALATVIASSISRASTRGTGPRASLPPA